MEPFDFSQPATFASICLIFLVIVMFRYVAIAGIFHLIFYVVKPKAFDQRKVNLRFSPDSEQFRKEFFWSSVTSVIFALAGATMALLWQMGYTKIYTDINEYSWAYLIFSLVVAMFIHETYYYWLHRWMHRPAVYGLIHKVHHHSTVTSPWTSFSFHPIEGVLQSLIIPVILFVLPMHYYAIITLLTLMTLTSAINHLNIEIYPRKTLQNFFGQLWIGATHHSLHHSQFRYNYGLYFTFWDKWMKTESPDFKPLFEEKTKKSNS
ncbi:sterol desaturase family protein [Penaeicola halotolerans]|uniref:sterol desaturase family protein n=1 Tax=Penaeicola halotolerans TaxID=2793196 RepID=UPI001CF8A87F|nr:sterol desaturase family protein [Penaeicola halotolerans]